MCTFINFKLVQIGIPTLERIKISKNSRLTKPKVTVTATAEEKIRKMEIVVLSQKDSFLVRILTELEPLRQQIIKRKIK